MEQKYIICKPKCGMIDIFTFIVTALKYAVKFNRILVIDTRLSLHFKNGFTKYFDINNDNTYKNDIDELYNFLEGKSILQKINIKDFNINTKLNPIDLNKNYDEEIILFGNQYANFKRDIIYFFKNFYCKPIIIDIFQDKFKSLPNNYISVHIRNTDKKSNVVDFLKKNYDYFENKPIFLATDDACTLFMFKQIFEDNLFSYFDFSELQNITHLCGEHSNNNDTIRDSSNALMFKPTKNSIRPADSHSSWSMNDKEINPSPKGADLNLQRFKYENDIFYFENNKKCINFDKIDIFFKTNISKPIHYCRKRNNKEQEKFDIDTMVDLLLLSNSTKYFYSCHTSGFSNSVRFLFEEKILKLYTIVV